jgi:hypothetical protein
MADILSVIDINQTNDYNALPANRYIGVSVAKSGDVSIVVLNPILP